MLELRRLAMLLLSLCRKDIEFQNGSMVVAAQEMLPKPINSG
jgi:hypothetical protein